MKAAQKTAIKTTLTELYDITFNAGEFISDMLNAFIYNKASLLQGYREAAGRYLVDIGRISAAMEETAGKDAEAEPYAAVPGHLRKILISLNRMYDLTEKKIQGNILFPDKYVDETIYLLQRLIEILRPAADMILARNTFLKKYIEESQKSIERNATAYATMHEDTLITGERLPPASSIHVAMLEAIKEVAWNTKEIAAALAIAGKS